MILVVLILVIILCILTGGFCSGSETAFVSADHLLLDEPLAVHPEQSRDVVAVLHAAHRSGLRGDELIDVDQR